MYSRITSTRRFANRKSRLVFSLVSRGKRGLGGFLGTLLLRQFPTYSIYLWANKKWPKTAVQIKNFWGTNPSFNFTSATSGGSGWHLDLDSSENSAKIWTKMRPKIKGHQKNGSVPKWIEFDTNRSNTMKILKLELKPLHSRFQKSWDFKSAICGPLNTPRSWQKKQVL